jgi:hypothetical protein
MPDRIWRRLWFSTTMVKILVVAAVRDAIATVAEELGGEGAAWLGFALTK